MGVHVTDTRPEKFFAFDKPQDLVVRRDRGLHLLLQVMHEGLPVAQMTKCDFSDHERMHEDAFLVQKFE